MAKETYMRFRCDGDFKAQVEALASKENRTVSNYMENLLKREIAEMERKESKKINYDSVIKASRDFNNWQGSASIMLDKADGEVWTDVFVNDNDTKRYHSDSIMTIYGKDNMGGRNDKIWKDKLFGLAEYAIDKEFECLHDLLYNYFDNKNI